MIKYERIFTDEEEAILKHDILDITAWMDGAALGKINNCKKRAAIACRELLKSQGAEMVPASDDTAVQLLFSQPDYKDRAAREAYDANRFITKETEAVSPDKLNI